MMTDDITKRDRDDVIFNKRQVPRLGVELSVSFEIATGGPHGFYTGITEDIGTGGIFLSTPQTLPVGTKMRVSFLVEEREIAAEAEVRWVREADASQSVGVTPGMGLRFIEIAAEDRTFISDYVKQKETIYYDEDDVADSPEETP
jgi:uncharacterized protein (TIGR02266 family)